jgi:glycosyltransferase involved in cell wall biosynthesis
VQVCCISAIEGRAIRTILRLPTVPEARPGQGPRTFITWYPYCRRSDALAEQLGASSYLVHYLRFKVPWVAPVKYVLQSLKTVSILVRERPSLVLVANPPVAAPLLIWLGSRLFRYQFIIDAHSGAFQHSRWAWSLPLQRFLARRALTTVVTNDHLAKVVHSWGAASTLVQDLALKLDPAGRALRKSAFHAVFICTYSVDEPVEAVIETAREEPGIQFSFTGDPEYLGASLKRRLPANVQLTGFLPDDEYLALLRGADVILSLTNEDHTMQRGGYEAMSLEKPLVTTNWPLLRQVFARGTVHVDNTPAQIAAAIHTIQANPQSWSAAMATLKREREVVSRSQIQVLRQLLGECGLKRRSA